MFGVFMSSTLRVCQKKPGNVEEWINDLSVIATLGWGHCNTGDYNNYKEEIIFSFENLRVKAANAYSSTEYCKFVVCIRLCKIYVTLRKCILLFYMETN